MLKEYISDLSRDKINRVRLGGDRVVLPSKVDPRDFYRKCRSRIEVSSLTDEKAIYTASLKDQNVNKSVSDLLFSKGR